VQKGLNMFIGICVLALFACGWCVFGLVAARAPRWQLAVPPVISAALIGFGSRAVSLSGPSGVSARVGRAVGLWSTIEGVAIFIVIRTAIRYKRPDAIAPLIAIIVGLHFLPLAYEMPFRLYYATGTVLILIGAVGFWLRHAQSRVFVGLAAAAALWATAALVLAKIA
jgi:hypothetical protein